MGLPLDQAVLDAVQAISAQHTAEDMYRVAIDRVFSVCVPRHAYLAVLGPDGIPRNVAFLDTDSYPDTQIATPEAPLGAVVEKSAAIMRAAQQSGKDPASSPDPRGDGRGPFHVLGRSVDHLVMLHLDRPIELQPPERLVGARAIATQVAISCTNLARLARYEQERNAAQVMARAAREDLDSITYWVGHDLRTPLTSVVGFTQILLDDWLSVPREEVESMLSTIDQSSMKMAEIIEEILVVARLRRGDVERTALDMGDIVGQTQIRLANAIRRHDARVVAASSWPTARGYRPWIEAVWSTLIRNSLEHAGRPPALELGSTTQDDGSIRFWLRNNGPGLSEADKADLLPQTSPAHNGRIQGHGLLLVKQVIERLDGEMGIDSSPGHGCTYYFTLPAS